MKLQLLSLLQLASCARASVSWSQNLNYRSPSQHHPSLGIAIHKVVKRNDPASAYAASSLNFTHGVASGDPYPNSVILWTRVAPQSDNSQSNVTVSGYAPLFDHDNEKYVHVSKAPICVEYNVYEHKDSSSAVDSGKVYTSSDVDFTVKVEAKNLKPFTTYYYQFNVCGSDNKSPVGRTKTTPNADDDITNVSLAVYSCSNYPFGFFNAYGNPVRKVCYIRFVLKLLLANYIQDSVDYVIHLGDYIYKYKNGDYGWGNSIGRIPQPDREIFTLYDYRRRLATYRTDLDLVASHQQFPWIPVWDDHEVGDNTVCPGIISYTKEFY